ncbi:MAG: glutathione S-transferase family protein [Pseudomonadota bacterium]
MTQADHHSIADNPFGEFVLYGWAGSFFASKTRSYLRKAQVPFREVTIGHPHFTSVVQPFLERPIVPVIQTREGVIVQDSNEISDYVLAHGLGERSLIPPTPVQAMAARVLEFLFSETLARIAFSTRWSHYHDQEAYVREVFGSTHGYGTDKDEAGRNFVADLARDAIFAVLEGFGIEPRTLKLIEQQYRDLLDLLNAHFAVHPYLFGAGESIADCALNGALAPHLSRDPYPGMTMRQRAPRVLRYAERMSQRDPDFPEYVDAQAGELVAEDALPETLKPIIALMVRDGLPEIKAAVEAFDEWASTAEREPGKPILPSRAIRMVARTDFHVRSIPMRSIAQPNTIWALGRVHKAFDALTNEEQESVRKTLAPLGVTELLDLRTRFALERRQHAEVWAEAAG